MRYMPEEDDQETAPWILSLKARVIGLGSVFFSFLGFFLVQGFTTLQNSPTREVAVAHLGATLHGLWPITGLVAAVLLALVILVLVCLCSMLLSRGGRLRYWFLGLGVVWIGLWASLYVYLRELVWRYYFHLRLDAFLGLGGIVIILLMSVLALTYLSCRHQGKAFLPQGMWAKRYLLLLFGLFIVFGIVLPQGFPGLVSHRVRDLALSDLLARAMRSPAYWWAEARRGSLTPGYIRVSFDSAGTLDDLLLRFVSRKGRGAGFAYQPSGLFSRGLTSTRLPLVIYPTSASTRTAPGFTTDGLAETLSLLDEKGILDLLRESLETYHGLTEQPTEWSSCTIEIGTIWPEDIEVPLPSALNISLTVSRILPEHGIMHHYTLFTSYISPQDLSITGLKEQQRIPSSWIP